MKEGSGFFEAIPAERVGALLAAMPKTELHVHVEGALEPELAFKIARRNGLSLPFENAEAMREAAKFEDLQGFLDAYMVGAGVLRSREDFKEMGLAYLDRAALDGVVHAEIFCDTASHQANGVDPLNVIDGLADACEVARERGQGSQLILCVLRHLDETAAFETLAVAMERREKIVALGLASAERGNPPEKFARVFKAAKAAGFRFVAHAGEEGPADYVRQALDLGASRIDHGVAALSDASLVARLVQEKVPLTVCPLSNVCLKVTPSMALHPIKRMLELGLAASVHSDDPSYFGGHVNANLLAAHEALSFSPQQAYQLAANSIEGAFMEQSIKLSRLRELQGVFESFREPAPRRRQVFG
jgi:adenosine deaminase